MTKQRKRPTSAAGRFSKEEKLKIIEEAGTQGGRITLEKYGVYAATYYSWKRKFNEMGEDGFTHGMTRPIPMIVRQWE